MIGCLKTIIKGTAKKRFYSTHVYFACCCVFLLTVFPNSDAHAQKRTKTKADTTVHRNGFIEVLRIAGRGAVREIKNIIIVPPKNGSAADTFNVESPEKIYLGTTGHIIDKIRIIRLKPFGTSVTEDTVPRNLSWLGRAGNTVHVNTREFIIRNALLFREGDLVSAFKLADSERFLRELRYIDDARIIAIPVSEDHAEVVVLVQDIFPYAVSFGTNFASNANFSVTNRNILGVGVELKAGSFIDSRKDRLMGYEGMLRVQNIGHTFITFQADYLDRYENKRLGFMFTRDFYAPTTKYAGHLSFYDSQVPVNFNHPEVPDPLTYPILVRFNYTDVWLGRSFLINKNPFNKQRNNITVSLGAQRTYFIDRPENSQSLYYKFQNRTTLLSSLTYSQQAYYTANYIYNYGRTEDIPYGYLASVVAGKEFNELYDRPYIGANFSAGYYLPKLGYLSGQAVYGTFFRKGTEQGTVSVELNYFTNLYVIGRYSQRTFINGQYTRQLDTRLDDYLIIDGDYGIPGFRNDSIMGRHRFNISAEQDLFTPWKPGGFRFVMYAFANVCWLGGYDKNILESTCYTSFGVGFRIRNNRLIFNTLQIQFAYFPNIPSNSRFRYIEFSKETVLKPRNFMPKAPAVVPLY